MPDVQECCRKESAALSTLGRRPPTLQLGQTLRERYQILGMIGAGGMSTVYEARDLTFPHVIRKVAIKEVYISVANPRREKQRYLQFEREVDILADLHHPAIPKIYEYFREGAYCYLALELVHGQNLQNLLAQNARPFPVQTVLRWAIEICDVLHYLHTREPAPLIFRDLKPSNIMLNEHDHIVLIDFGIAKTLREEKRGTMIGTEGYSPPEQYRGEATPRSDIYSLGATMHHLLSGQDPAKDAPFSFAERPLHDYVPDIPSRLECIISRMLAYSPTDRYATVQEVRRELDLLRDDHQSRNVETTACVPPVSRSHSTKEVAPLWTFCCNDEIRSSPRIGAGTVFVGCYDSNLYAVDAKGGQLIWKYATEGGIAATPAIWQDLVLVGSEDFVMHALNRRTGRPHWAFPTKGRIRSSVRVAYDHAFFGSDDQTIYALQARSGREVWRTQTEGPVRSTPSIFDEALYVGSEDGYVYALHLQRGGVLWRSHCGGGVTSSPLLHEGLVIVGSTDRTLYALDIHSGMPIWRFRVGQAIVSSPTLLNGLIYVGSADGNLYAIDAVSGRLRWRLETDGQVNSSPAVTPEAIYVGSTDGWLYVAETRTGKLRWKFMAQGPIVSSPCVNEENVYFGSLDRHLYALPAQAV